MPVVTGVVERRDRSRVFIDGELWAELDPKVAVERGLCEGATFSCQELAEARLAGERPLVMNKALNALGYRARSVRELRERLLRAGYATETVDVVLGRLKELGYLDDEEFARNAARGKVRKRYGPRRIYADLRRAGIGEETIQGVLEEEFAAFSEYEVALTAARQRYNMGEDSGASLHQARRVYGFLMRRGYSASVCAEVAHQYRLGDQ